MRSATLALLCLVILLAGCSSIAGGNATADGPTTATTATTVSPTAEQQPTTASPTEAQTPTDRPPSSDTSTRTATPTPTVETPAESPATVTPTASASYPPGIGPDGIRNLTALREAHRETLSQAGFTVEQRRNLTTDVQTRGIYRQAVAAPGRLPYRTVERTTENGTLDRISLRWANETIRLSRYQRRTDDEFEYSQEGLPDPADADIADWHLFDTIDRGIYELQSVSRSGDERLFRLVATGFDRDDERTQRTNVTAYRGELVVDSDGVVRQANVTTRGGNDEATYTATVDFEVRARGTTTVEQPAWVRDRLDSALAVTVSAAMVDDRYIRLTNTGREPISASSELSLWWASCGHSTATLASPIAPGETAYVYVNETDTYRLGINRSGPGGPARELDNPSDLTVLAPSAAGEEREVSARVDVEPATNDSGAAGRLATTAKSTSTGSPKRSSAASDVGCAR